nr:MAG TPA_asm: hypothetical protein [Caudoviricetes sp.]
MSDLEAVIRAGACCMRGDCEDDNCFQTGSV